MSNLQITMNEDLLTALKKETERLETRVSTYISNLVAKELGDKVDITEEENETPVERRICKIRLSGYDADYIQRKSRELNITPSQFIGKLIAEQNANVVNVNFLDDFMDEFREIENHIRKICYYASKDDSISEQLVKDALTKLNGLIALFCDIYKELIKTKHSILKKADKSMKGGE